MVHPHEFRVTGTCRQGRAGWRMDVGSEVPEAAESFLRHLMVAKRYLLWRVPKEDNEEEAFLHELLSRGYDMSTLRFSIFQLGHGTPQKPRVLRLRPGTLHARWGWQEHDHSPDLCSCWAQPARRRDSAYFMSLMSARAEFTPFAAALARETRKYGGVLEQLKEHGWDVRTLKFSVRHLGWLYRPECADREPPASWRP